MNLADHRSKEVVTERSDTAAATTACRRFSARYKHPRGYNTSMKRRARADVVKHLLAGSPVSPRGRRYFVIFVIVVFERYVDGDHLATV